MAVVVITGSAGLIGSEAASFFAEQGFDVVGIDNNLRGYFFGSDGSTAWNLERLRSRLSRYVHVDADIRDEQAIGEVFARYGRDIAAVVHAAAQPSHDWAVREPLTDFTVNALGTLVLLEATRRHCPDSAFIFTSTNKVYGDRPNHLPLVELDTRWEVDPAHRYAAQGIDESMSIDTSLHSLFGASKVAADVLVQEYARYFGMKTVCFRGGCVTGPAHAGAQLHGFLAYLVKCAVTDTPYTVFGYKAKQVRDNLHSRDLVSSFWQYFLRPRGGEVYNLGGGRASNCSVLEAIDLVERQVGRPVRWTYSETSRPGDHVWWVSDIGKFRSHYPDWTITTSLDRIVTEIVDAQLHRDEPLCH